LSELFNNTHKDICEMTLIKTKSFVTGVMMYLTEESLKEILKTCTDLNRQVK